jgi:hypothetical protein
MKNLTAKQAVKMFQTKTITFADGDIQHYRDHGRDVWIDNRTERKPQPEAPTVFPFALDSWHVFIVCPYCGEIHAHGNANGEYEGVRVSHCATPLHPNYYIKQI